MDTYSSWQDIGSIAHGKWAMSLTLAGVVELASSD
jgi:hypothetical protein